MFKNNTSFRLCVSKINNTFIDNAEDLDVAMPMYNLLEYSDNYSMISGTFWSYYRDEVNDAANENYAASNQINNSKITTSRYFKCKAKLIGNAPNNNSRSNAETVVPLKYLSNF